MLVHAAVITVTSTRTPLLRGRTYLISLCARCERACTTLLCIHNVCAKQLQCFYSRLEFCKLKLQSRRKRGSTVGAALCQRSGVGEERTEEEACRAQRRGARTAEERRFYMYCLGPARINGGGEHHSTPPLGVPTVSGVQIVSTAYP